MMFGHVYIGQVVLQRGLAAIRPLHELETAP